MKNRFGLLIAAAVSMACFSLPSVADIESVTPAVFYQVEVTPQALGEVEAIAAKAAVDAQTEQVSSEFPEVISCNCTVIGNYVVYHDAGSRTIEPDGSGVFANVTDNGVATPFEVGWRNTKI
ncbi:MAG: hypothetical protein K6L74_16765 [Neptuniibacter sp.]